MFWTYFISDLSVKEIAGTFYERELQKTNQKEFRVQKVIKNMAINNMLNEKAKLVILIGALIKKR